MQNKLLKYLLCSQKNKIKNKIYVENTKSLDP